MSHYHLDTAESYKKAYQESLENPEAFWAGIAKDNFLWQKPWDKTFDWDQKNTEVKWFLGGKLNITENLLDRHLAHNGDKTAIIFEPNDLDESPQKISYSDLAKSVNKMANVLKDQGVGKGDRVCIYLPMIPELAIAVLACARIGAIHSVVFAGFSSTALAARINDCDCTLVITSDGGFRGAKTIDLKNIVDQALEDCPGIQKTLVVARTNQKINMVPGRDFWLKPLFDQASDHCPATIMDAEDPLFILYTSGSTGKPKGMVHTCGGYMVYTAYTFKNVFQYTEQDIYWCSADIGWITGHSYILYGPLANGATTVMFEGVPSYPDFGRFWAIIEKYKITQFYTAPTAIRALAKESLDFVTPYDLSSLKVLGTVGEPINEEAWQWYFNHIGQGKVPIVDTWWQTETGGVMIAPLPGITRAIPTYATLPLPGIQPVLLDEQGNEIKTQEGSGLLFIKHPWPSIARTIWGDHQRYVQTYFGAQKDKYMTGDGATRDAQGNYRITGRVDDVIIVSGHNLGTAPIEDAINEHELVAESAVIGVPHPIKGNSLFGFIILKNSFENEASLKNQINQSIAQQIGPIAKLDEMVFTPGLPKTRSGKIMRRILRNIAQKNFDALGDTSTLLNPEIVKDLIAMMQKK
ncbi:acetate--CoA ligase [Flavobacteriaceae bacterium]|nr:acetate--CoA ligase [Flavobacteriaceae bacterium]MDB2463536.1 acetate--CoA ligase [Flavobacteriaceae bacterium]MDB2587710.1 acetate--CoA ligase [Flavobacteriaceae bacterium]